MCGIIGYSGRKNAVEILLSGLKTLEYRGYDSSGIAVFCQGKTVTVKSEGRLENTIRLCAERGLKGYCGIGHTRWATHGEVSTANSHPHTKGKTTLVHNGIIENYAELKKELEDKYDFASQTDSEVACALIDCLYNEYNDPLEALSEARRRLKGSFAFAVMFEDREHCIYAMRRDSPLVISSDDDGIYLASDISALASAELRYFRPSREIAVIQKGRVKFFLDGEWVLPEVFKADRSHEGVSKEGFRHFMLKEIHEEPKVIRKTLDAYIKDGMISFEFDDILSSVRRIRIIACGTALHAGMAGAYIIEKMAALPCRCEVASEFRYNAPEEMKGELVIIISQSGETADTLAALRIAKRLGALTLSIVNVPSSSVARESDMVIYTRAGAEIAVASTKAYSTQLCLLYLICFRLAYKRKRLSPSEVKALCDILYYDVTEAVQSVIDSKGIIMSAAKSYSKNENMFFIGRGLDYLLCEEASLKLKEISYIHSEAYPAGELKHGTISLITENTPVVAILSDAQIFSKTESNIKEVKARGGRVIVFTTEKRRDEWDDMIPLPETDPLFAPFTAAAAFQLFAYYISLERGCDIDKPRNLAKSVTVE